MSWFIRGENAAELAKDIEEEISQKFPGNYDKYFRFRLGKGEDAKISFLDRPAFYFSEHTVMIGKRPYRLTCIRDVVEEVDGKMIKRTCPLCEEGYKPSLMLACTIINHNEYESKSGKKLKHRKQLLTVKHKARTALEKQVAMYGDEMVYMLYEASRDNQQNTCATGELFTSVKGKRWTEPELQQMISDPEQTLEEFVAPFDYEEAFAVKTDQEIYEMLGKADPKSNMGKGIGGSISEKDSNEVDSLSDLL